MLAHILGTGSKGNCILIEENSHYLIFDCGVPFREVLKAVKFRVNDIDACFVSHFHNDHCKAIEDVDKAYIPILSSAHMRALYPFAIDIDNGDWYEIGQWRLRAIELEHDEDNIGLVAVNRNTDENICYISDTCFIKANPIGLQNIIVECNYCENLLKTNEEERFQRIRGSHMSLERLCKWLSKIDKSKLQKIILVHLSDTNANEALMIKTIAELTGVEVFAPQNGESIDLSECPF